MKIFRKLSVFVVAVLAVALFVVGFFGVSTKYGEITSTYVNGAQNIRFSGDFSTVASIVFSPSASGEDALSLTADDLDAIKYVIEKRLEVMQLGDYAVQCDYENGKIKVTLPVNNTVQGNLNWVVSILGSQGSVSAYEGNVDTVEGLEPIYTNDQVLRTTYSFQQDIFATYHQLNMSLDSVGRKALREVTSSMKSELDATEETQYISMWYEGAKVGTIRITEEIRNGKIMLSSTSMEDETLNDLMILLNSGSLPYAMVSESTVTLPGSFGESEVTAVSNLGIALLVGCGVIALYLLVRFRIIGIAGILSVMGAVGFAMCFASGFMLGRGIIGTIGALTGLLAVAFLGFETCIRNGNAVASALKSNSVILGISQGMKLTLWDSVVTHIAALLIGIIFMLCESAGSMASLMRMLGVNQTGMTAIGNFGSVLVAGVPASFVFGILGSYLMISTAADVLKKPALYGGNEHA